MLLLLRTLMHTKIKHEHNFKTHILDFIIICKLTCCLCIATTHTHKDIALTAIECLDQDSLSLASWIYRK